MLPQVDEIAAMEDPRLRNLWITQTYHRLAVMLRDVGAQHDATWCAFAVWASKTAGATIRGEILPDRLRELLEADHETESRLHHFNHTVAHLLTSHLHRGHLTEAFDGVLADTSNAIAAGNLLVFAELAPLFMAVIDAWSGPVPPDSGACAATLGAALASLEASGVDTAPLRTAFEMYWRALGDPASRGHLILGANVLAVAHEQSRLQPAISEALDAAVRDIFDNVIERDLVDHVPDVPGRSLLTMTTDVVSEHLEKTWRTALTELLMQLETSDEVLDLSHNVPPLQGVMFPEELAELSDAEVAAVVSQWDRTGGTGDPTGAHDWSVIDERMNYIVTLFRSRQRHAALFDPPFTDAQLSELAAGRLPAGPL